MTLSKLWGACLFLMLIAAACPQGQGKNLEPTPPEVLAKRREVSELRDKGRRLAKEGKIPEAIAVLQLAATKEDEVLKHSSSAKYLLAKLLEQEGRTEEALATYKRAVRWDADRRDLRINGVDAVHLSMDYAILLSIQGRAEDAKAMYYFGLRCLSGTRYGEPVPFLVVFDQEPEGCVWEYSKERLQAAAQMIKLMRGGESEESDDQRLAKIRSLAPGWFYPTMYEAACGWKREESAVWLAEAEALANPGVEKELVARYKVELAEHKALNEQRQTPWARDERPMREGIVRRNRMQCMKPNFEVLKKLSVGG